MTSKPVYVLNGPNLNLLGEREKDVYGAETLAGIEQRCRLVAAEHDLAIEFRQTNQESDLVSWVQEARSRAAAVILNAAAYTHTSVAVHDALKMLSIPVVEVHLSNIYKREPFRHHSYVSPVATGVICGFGARGYELALEAVAGLVKSKAA
ncbi:MAG: type II 3-dehydroquinate dehydratase [Hyphomicrobiales bacterium]